ncbi:MAG: DUF3551 domain-containing protein [Pseudolabrys sp.]
MRLKTTALAAFIVVVAAASLTACVSAPKRVGPWCAIADQGGNLVTQDCSYFSVEECRQAILAGNRGMCGRNPRWPVDGRAARG